MISTASYGLLTSPKKQTDEFVFFAFLLFTANKTNSPVCFLGEFSAHQSGFWFYLTISRDSVCSCWLKRLCQEWKNISFFQVILPGDRKTDDAPNRDKPPGMEDQLLAVQSHTEDLEVKMNFRFHQKFSIQFSQYDLS